MNTIIFLHGGTLNKNMWLPQIEELENEFRILVIDLPRHGENIEKPFTFNSAVTMVAQFIESEQVAGKVTLVGLSLGGYVAIEYINRYPDQIFGLVLSGCCIQYFGIMGLFAKISMAFSSLISQRKFEVKQKRVLMKVTSSSIVEEMSNSGLSLLGGRESMKEVVDRDFVKIVDSINVPILLVNGENDRLNRWYEYKYLQGNTNVSLEIVKDSGHLCSLENPLLFSQIIRNFMSEIHA